MTKLENTYWIIGLLIADILSFEIYYIPALRPILFSILIISFIFVCVKNLELGVLIALTELFVGSKGYLFSFSLNGFEISIRLALFVILLLCSISNFIKYDKAEQRQFFQWGKPILLFFFIVILAFSHGLLRGHGFKQVFFDANAYFFIGFLLPVYIVSLDKKFFDRVVSVLIISAVYLSLKTLLILYFLTHDFWYLNFALYHWVRGSGVGEITRTTTGAWRVFIQSQIYIIVAWWVVLVSALPNKSLTFTFAKVRGSSPAVPLCGTGYSLKVRDKLSRPWLWRLVGLSFFAGAILISFSRSFWLGLIIAGLAAAGFVIYQRQWMNVAYLALMSIASALLGLVLIIGILKIPFPATSSTGAIDLGKRFDVIAEEAASSRWNLLPPLWRAVQNNYIFGSGFGAPVTYISNDPRIRSESPSGLYTTTAFEWGYLDIWLKLGFIGLLIYAWLIVKIFIHAATLFTQLPPLARGLVFGLIAVLAVNIGSPYLNHPLGLGFILVLYAYFVKLPPRELSS